MDESTSHAPVCLALKAAQASLAEGLIRLRVASTTRPPAPSAEESESLARGIGVLPGGRGDATGGGLSSLYFPGGLGSFQEFSLHHPAFHLHGRLFLSHPRPGGSGDQSTLVCPR